MVLGRYLRLSTWTLGQRVQESASAERERESLWVLLGFEGGLFWRDFEWSGTTSTPQVPFKTPQIPSNRDHKALNRGTLGGSR